jgi:hypothetical protein
MYNTFILTLENDNSTYDITFDIFSTSIAQRWASEVEKNYPFFETTRFQGWPDKDFNYYVTELEKQITIVNRYRPNTVDNVGFVNQEKLNYLHKFFEVLRGPIESGTDFYNTAPADVKDAIMKFNVLIHEFEHFTRDSDEPTIIGTYKDRPRIELLDEDYEHFTFKWKSGTVYINYCEVGKTLLDAFKDNDTIVGKDNVRPLKYYSADFMIKFGLTVPDEFYQKRLLDFNNWYKTTNYNFEHLSLGLIPVAHLSSNIDKLTNYTRIKKTCIK